MPLIGTAFLWISFVSAFASMALCAIAGIVGGKPKAARRAKAAALVGRAFALLVFVALFAACALIVYCFFSGDNSLSYVVQYRSKSTSDLLWFYTLAGLWAGKQGSLLFWAWIIAAFGAFVILRRRGDFDRLDAFGQALSQAVLCLFVALLLFSEANMPFAASPDTLVNADGSLTATGALYGMNSLLEHWAMAIHPPTLFIGYAGLTLPFAYALAAFVLGDDSCAWIERMNGITRFSWLFLGIGIGLGSIWAYVVLGWGGYWGWDPVENASFLSWIACTSLIHSMTVARRWGSFKRWAITSACFSFMFVIVGTFISRSGLVQSVHAFTGDAVSLVFFIVLIALTFVAGLCGAFARPKSFAVKNAGEEGGAYASREMAYFLLNVIMMAVAFLLAFMTLSSALPDWMPLGGESLDSSTYDSLARPIGIVVALIIAVCPLFGWKRTDPAGFVKNAKLPALCALALFILLMIYFVMYLLPSYDATAAQGDSTATTLAEYGPAWYYNAVAVVAFAVACVLLFNSLFTLGRMTRSLRAQRNGHFVGVLRRLAPTFGGLVAHASMGIIIIGMVGSSMYVTEQTDYVAASEDSTASESIAVQNYTLTPCGNDAWQEGEYTYVYELSLDVYRDGEYLCTVSPTLQYDAVTQQQKLNAAVVSLPSHDLFVVYRGTNDAGDYSLDVRVNPLINLVWLGFVLLMIGTAIPLLAKPANRRVARAAGGANASAGAGPEPGDGAEPDADPEPGADAGDEIA